MTRSLCNSASAALELLTRDLESGERVEYRDRNGLHMMLYVERLADCAAGSLFTVEHRHDATNPDPRVLLLRSFDGCSVPLEIATPFARVVTAAAGDRVRVIPRDEHRRLVKLVEVWACNVRVNLLRARHAFQKEEMCSPVAYLAE